VITQERSSHICKEGKGWHFGKGSSNGLSSITSKRGGKGRLPRRKVGADHAFLLLERKKKGDGPHCPSIGEVGSVDGFFFIARKE